MQPQLILVLLAAAASARPIPELESSQIEALYTARDATTTDADAGHTHHARELETSQIEALYAARDASTHKHHARELESSQIEALYAERRKEAGEALYVAREEDNAAAHAHHARHEAVEERELESSQIEALYADEDRHHAFAHRGHHGDWAHHGPARHGHHSVSLSSFVLRC